MTNFLASIPSPSNGVFDLGPIPIRMYGLLIAIGIITAAKISEVRWRNRGHNPDDINALFVWVVICGVIGARAYHVITDNQLFRDDWLKVFQIWKGGLGIWGAVIGGSLAVIVLSKKRNLPTLELLDIMGPTVLVALAIGRFGNYFNQELFGKPTTLPWALEIGSAHRPPGYQQYSTFHPTFLYEALWDMTVFFFLSWWGKRVRLVKGQMFCAFVALYTFGRFWVENLRIDTAHKIGPMRLNAWTSVVVFTVAIVAFMLLGRRGEPEPEVAVELAPEGEPAA